MKNAIRRSLWKILGTPPGIASPYWKRPLDALAPRHQVVDMAIVNIQVATRNEAAPARSAEDQTLLGDYLEFGVFQGDTFIHAFKRADTRIPTMRYFAFDSFEGLPEVKGVDAGAEFSTGQFSCSEPEFKRRLEHNEVDLQRCVSVPGWFDKTLTPELKAKHQLFVASIAYIDCDLYESCVPVLAFLTDLVRQGSILIFDDWFHFRADPNRGVQKATGEWLAANPHISLIPWLDMAHHGKCFFVHMNNRSE